MSTENKAANGAVKKEEPKEKTLPSNKELKELKKKEKAAKRAAAKAATETSNGTGASTTNGSEPSKPQSKSNIKKQLNQTKTIERQKVAPLFSHLETRGQRELSSSILASLVHPAVLSLALKFSTYQIVGSTPRCREMLLAFKQVIQSYSTPEGTTLSRNLTMNLSHQIDYLKTSRPLSVTMGNSIRWLKQEISLIPIDMKDEDAKIELALKIDQFIREKIELPHDVIIESTSKHISEDSTILTYGHSEVLSKLFLHNAAIGKKFTVIIVDSRPLFEGRKLAKKLTLGGVNCQYVLINALSSVIEDVDYIMLGAHAMLSNGRLYSRVGTALIAMSAKSRNVPVLVCCESIKFSDKVQLDSVTQNELADGDDLINTGSKPIKKTGVALELYLKTKELEALKDKKQQSKQQQQQKKDEQLTTIVNKLQPLLDWKDLPHLNILNIMYDLTPPEYIKKIITEVGALPPSSVPVILREYKNT